MQVELGRVAHAAIEALPHVAAEAAPVVRALPTPASLAFDVDVLIGGAGPGGGSAAVVAALRGARVLVAEQRPLAGVGAWGARWQQALVRTENMATLQELEVADELFHDARSTLLDTSARRRGVVTIGGTERALHRVATAHGAEFSFGTAVEDVVPLEGGGVMARLGGGRQVRARTYIDATGGRSPFLDRYGIGLGPPLNSESSYFLGHYPVQAPGPENFVRGTTADGRRFWNPVAGDVSVTVLNHPEHGAHVDISTSKRLPDDPEILAEMHKRLARSAGVTGAPLSDPYMVRVMEREVGRVVGVGPAGEQLDMIVVGDGVSRKRPREGKGLNSALRDGRAAALAALAEGEERTKAFAELSPVSLKYHEEGMTSMSYAAREARRRAADMARLQAG
ncbi:MAG: binding domain [Thermoleophilia bacterium]|nr:binding domain [Thermoleophilia bacterium]